MGSATHTFSIERLKEQKNTKIIHLNYGNTNSVDLPQGTIRGVISETAYPVRK